MIANILGMHIGNRVKIGDFMGRLKSVHLEFLEFEMDENFQLKYGTKVD